MRLNTLKLRTFKGIKDFKLDIDGKDINIYGENGTGKTTIADAWFWLLFGKDSLNRSDFEIKTLSEDGQPIHGLEHEVEGVLDLDVTMLTLKKVYSENWVKQRGSANKEFTGHSTSHFLNGVPVKKGEYEAKIASIIDEGAFKLLTNPRQFNEVLSWQKRRELLMQVCGDISDFEVIASDNKLNELPNILDGRKLEDHRKVIIAKKSEINKSLTMIPVRIDETQRGLPIEAIAPANLVSLKEERNKKSQELANLTAGGGMAEKVMELRSCEAEMLKIQNAHQSQTADKIQTAKMELRNLEDTAASLAFTIKSNHRQVEENQMGIGGFNTHMQQLRAEWQDVNGRVFNTQDYCVACGQLLPNT